MVGAPPSNPHSLPTIDVLCEKPMCTTIEDCLRVRELVRQRDEECSRAPIFWVGLEYRFVPAITRLISEVDAGTIGSLKMCHIREHRFPL